MKYLLPFFFLIVGFTTTKGQDFKTSGTFPEIINQTRPNYVLRDSILGDLNTDSVLDLILLFDNTTPSGSRPLLIYVGQTNNTFKLKARNDSVVLCSDCGGVFGDPYTAIVIKNGYFTVEHYGGSAWRWTSYTTFKFAPKDHNWYLHKDGGDRFHVSSPGQKESWLFTTKDFGLIPFENFNHERIY
jgi:hypothetical protein